MTWRDLFRSAEAGCLKNEYSKQGYETVRSKYKPVLFTTIYNQYTLMCEEPLDIEGFRNHLKKYFWFDKIVCKHGTEFGYYVRFKDLPMPEAHLNDIIETITPFA